MRSPRRHPISGGFTSMELLVVIALAAIVMGALVVSYGTFVRSRPSAVSTVSVPLDSARLNRFYNKTDSDLRTTQAAPAYGSLALAEELREEFYHDIQSATAVFCLPRSEDNTWKPSHIAYDPLTDIELDTSQKFRAHIITKGAPASLYQDFRNPGTGQPNLPNVSIFILGYSGRPGHLRLQAIYDVDVIKFNSASAPLGFHASVKRYTDPKTIPSGTDYSLVFSGGYRVFYPPADPTVLTQSTVAKSVSVFASSTDSFMPLFVTFERQTRRSLSEDISIQRFKQAAERPFYFIWWPDPAAKNLGTQVITTDAKSPQNAYNHMAGRTSFMFTVPMFPSL